MNYATYFRFNLLPPNELITHISELQFGSGEYEDAKTQYYIQLGRWWSEGKAGPKPKHWRLVVGDKWAGIEIWRDADTQPVPELGFQRPTLYDPLKLQDLLLDSPRVIKAVHAAAEADGTSAAMRQLQKVLLSFFRNEFKLECETTWWGVDVDSPVSTGNNPDISVRWNKAFKFLEASVDLIAGCLLLNYEMFPREWAVRIMQHAEPSEQWLEHVHRVDVLDKPRQHHRIMVSAVNDGLATGLNVEPEPIKGLTYE